MPDQIQTTMEQAGYPAEKAAADALFREGANCWKTAQSSQMSVLVDCGNYYRDLHRSICRARHSIFILGWDIDSRIELLRGGDAREAGCPGTLFDLIHWKARREPQVQIYLNRWNYSLFLMQERESFSAFKWRRYAPDNIHFCLDSAIPFGACHHQKVVVVDDEIGFCGGADVAIARWDFRQHHTHNRKRVDPAGTFKPMEHVRYGPYHDIQCVVAGGAARVLAALARERWRLAAGFDAIPLRPAARTAEVPPAWPQEWRPDFTDIPTAITLTAPEMYGAAAQRQVGQMYIDLVNAAEEFIYIENQFLCLESFALALNKRLRERPQLRALLVSCHNAQGVMEARSMWSYRHRFRALLYADVADRVVMAYPLCEEDGVVEPVRIHSKVMAVDDKYLRIGSSNLNRRSMGTDTECDLVFAGTTPSARAKIAAIRTDLIREHTGHDAADIERWVHGGAGIADFIRRKENSTQHLVPIDDAKYKDMSFASLARLLSDPAKPLLPGEWTMPYNHPAAPRPWTLALRAILPVLALVLAFAVMWKFTPLAEYFKPERVAALLAAARESASLPLVLLCMVAGEFLMFPLVVMNAAAAAAFGPLAGFSLSMVAAMIAAALGFLAGRLCGNRLLKPLTGTLPERINAYLGRGGVIGMVILRTIPIAPYNAVNIGLGLTKVSFAVYMVGTFLGLVPGTLVTSFAAYSLAEVLLHPDSHSLLLAGGALVLWAAALAVAHFALRRYQKKNFR